MVEIAYLFKIQFGFVQWFPTSQSWLGIRVTRQICQCATTRYCFFIMGHKLSCTSLSYVLNKCGGA